MAAIDPSKKPNPIVALLANFCCFGIVGYMMCGQTKKAIYIFVVTAVLSMIGIGVVVAVLALIDVYQVAEGLQKGETLDENEYKFELLHKLMSLIDKSAVYNAPAA